MKETHHREYKERIIILTMKSKNKAEFERWRPIIRSIMNHAGGYLKANPPEKVNEVYKEDFLITLDPDTVRKIFSEITKLKSPSGANINGTIYKMPQDITFEAREGEIVIVQNTLKNLVPKYNLPKSTVEEEIREKRGLIQTTLYALSNKPEAIKKFISSLEKDMENKRCIVEKGEIYKCDQNTTYKRAVQGFSESVSFTCQPDKLTRIKILIPTINTPQQSNTPRAIVTYVPLIKLIPKMEEIFIRLPKLKQYAHEFMEYHQVIKENPSLTNGLLSGFGTEGVKQYNKYVNLLKESISKCTLFVDVLLQSGRAESRIPVNIKIDGGKQTYTVDAPNSIKVTDLGIITKQGEIINHTLRISTSNYIISETSTKGGFVAVMWIDVNASGLKYLENLHNKYENKILLKIGGFYPWTSGNCERVTL